jgi:hypothetical protein
VAFGCCRKCRGGTPAGERARSGRAAQAALLRGAPCAPLAYGSFDCGPHLIAVRLPAVHFLHFYFVIASGAKHIIQSEIPLLDCFVTSLLAMTA